MQAFLQALYFCIAVSSPFNIKVVMPIPNSMKTIIKINKSFFGIGSNSNLFFTLLFPHLLLLYKSFACSYAGNFDS